MHKTVCHLLALMTLFAAGPLLAEELRGDRLSRLLQPVPVAEVRAKLPEGITWLPDIPYRDGHALWTLDLAMPQAKSETPRPAVVLVHGGGWQRGDKRANIWARYPIELAARGFVAISINYRLLPDNPFPACIEDVKTAVRWLRAHADTYNVDVERIGAYGNSAGAHLALMLGLSAAEPELEGAGPWREQSSSVQSIVASASPTDLAGWSSPDGATVRLLGGPAANRESRARLASPLYHVSADAPPILLIHGTADSVVPYDQSRRLVQALVDAGAKDVAFKSYPGAGHQAFTQHLKETLPMTLGFFERTLGP